MKALTVHQPFAWAIVHGLRKWEVRRWPTPYRGPLLIHASRTRFHLHRPEDEWREELPGLDYDGLAFGAVVGVCSLAGCTEANGEYRWQFRDPRPLGRVVPWPGKPGLWDFPDQLLPPLPAPYAPGSRGGA